MVQLEFETYSGGREIKKSFFSPLFRRGLEILKREGKLRKILPTGTIHLGMISDEQITELNKIYRQKNASTDVLSFSYYEDQHFPGEDLIGEIVISIPTATRQAREHRKTLEEEVQFLFVHGLLHLFGYDHELSDERAIMFDLQDEILRTKSWRKIIG